MSGLIYQKEHRVKYYECDATKQISIPMLLNIMLYVSGEQSYKLGVGDAVLLEKGLSWIILQNDIHIQRLPEAGNHHDYNTSIKLQQIVYLSGIQSI